MEPTNISVLGPQLIDLTNNIVNLITFRDIYSYILLEILIIMFYISMESNRVESIKTLLIGIMIIMWIYTIVIIALSAIGFANLTGPQVFTFFMTPTMIVTVIALMLPLFSFYKGSGPQNPPTL
jgi:cytochrome c oxidase assembly factor CtaG